ncbi:MAG TPA: sigma-70 family RNA polymerase sigma factor [Candidatus Krumholzibacteria bacterium]|nr:sigma-70 family RNA polymerase sigma factor [Candidatus Krumholzibacteria bacterium]
MELPELLRYCQDGDEMAWEALVRRYQARVCGFAYHFVGSRDDARDLTQEIFVKIYRHLASCEDPQRFESWMFQVTRNTCRDFLRRQKARPPAQDIPIEEMHDLTAPGLAADEVAHLQTRKRLVHRALAELGEINREILLLKDIQGLSFEEIAGMLDLPVGTVKSRSSRARLALAGQIRRMVAGPEATGGAR